VSKDTIQPVTVLCALWGICKILVITDVGMPPWVITPVCYSLVFSYPDQTIWAVIQLRFPKLALPIAITVLNIAHDLGLC